MKLSAPPRFCLLIVIALLALVAGLASCSGGGGGSSGVPASAGDVPFKVEPVIAGLSFPASIKFAPDGRLFFSEVYSGRIRVAENGVIQTSPFVTFDNLGGDEVVLGIELDPDFSSNHYLYVFNTTANPLRSRVIRYRERDGRGGEPLVLIDNLPQGFHDGGILQFGADGQLYISIGDAADPNSAQDPARLSGKILRIGADGAIPGDNPIEGSPVFARGLRNVFGMTLHPDSNRIFFSDNGPDCSDEVNILQSGGNYGWREGQPCSESDSAFLAPVVLIDQPIGVTGVSFYQGEMFPEFENHLLVGDVNGGAIRRFAVDGETGEVGEALVMMEGGFGGILAIANSPDGSIYFSTIDGIYRIVRG